MNEKEIHINLANIRTRLLEFQLEDEADKLDEVADGITSTLDARDVIIEQTRKALEEERIESARLLSELQKLQACRRDHNRAKARRIAARMTLVA